MNFVDRLIRRRAPRPPVALEGRRVFAIGDIHGCDDLLQSLIDTLIDHSRSDPEPPLFVFLGDYVDRGPATRQVIERLIRLTEGGHRARFLCGNHEEAMLKFLTDVESGLAWPGYGGVATLRSYGVTPPKDETSLDGWRKAQKQFKDALPASHRRFFWSLEDSVVLGDYVFVHAGVDPDMPLARQAVRDLRWMREPFLSDTRRLEKVVVHGHTPTSHPHRDHRRIGVDSWAYKNGVLTAVELSGENQSFWQARRGPDGIACAPHQGDEEAQQQTAG